MIDLRSDTVTRPTPAMRRAMAEAEVGDDVYGEDPTVRAPRGAGRRARLGCPAALFVPTGTMGNQIAVHLQTIRGSEVIIEARGHIFNFEMGAMAALSGALPRPLVDRGRLPRAGPGRGRHRTPRSPTGRPTRLLCLENTHNLWSGLPMDAARTRALAEVAHAPRPAGAPRRRAHLQRRGGPRQDRRRARPWVRHGHVLPLEGPGGAGRLDAGAARPTSSPRRGGCARCFGGGMRQVGVARGRRARGAQRHGRPPPRGSRPREATGRRARRAVRGRPRPRRGCAPTSWSSACGPRRCPGTRPCRRRSASSAGCASAACCAAPSAPPRCAW